MKLEVVVCDVCQAPGRQAQGYTVTQGARTVARDLCVRHAAALEGFLGGSEERPLRRATRPRAGRVTITTMDEIEESKIKA